MLLIDGYFFKRDFSYFRHVRFVIFDFWLHLNRPEVFGWKLKPDLVICEFCYTLSAHFLLHFTVAADVVDKKCAGFFFFPFPKRHSLSIAGLFKARCLYWEWHQNPDPSEDHGPLISSFFFLNSHPSPATRSHWHSPSPHLFLRSANFFFIPLSECSSPDVFTFQELFLHSSQFKEQSAGEMNVVLIWATCCVCVCVWGGGGSKPWLKL